MPEVVSAPMPHAPYVTRDNPVPEPAFGDGLASGIMAAPVEPCRTDRSSAARSSHRRPGRAKAHVLATMVRSMAKIFLNHPIGDYDTWRPVFDADAPRREAAGMTNVSEAVVKIQPGGSGLWSRPGGLMV